MNKNSKQQDIIITKDFALGYKNKCLVSEVNLNIHKGEFIGILGRNGTGKSTFFRTLLGLQNPLAGKVFILGGKPSHGNKQIGYMPQMRHDISVANLTSRALLEAAWQGTRYGLPLPSKVKKQEIDNVLKIVKASGDADRPFQQLSGGERQRIYLAQALLGKPRILLLDEPLANLDPHFQETFVNLLRRIQKDFNVTILVTAHDPNPLLSAMNRVLFFANGKAAIGPTHEIITSDKLSALYGIPIEVVTIKERLYVLGEGQNIFGEEIHYHE